MTKGTFVQTSVGDSFVFVFNYIRFRHKFRSFPRGFLFTKGIVHHFINLQRKNGQKDKVSVKPLEKRKGRCKVLLRYDGSRDERRE